MAHHPLLKAIKTSSLEEVKNVITSEGIPFDSRWIDYQAVNQSIVDEHEEIAMFLLDHCECRVTKNNNAVVAAHDTPLHSAVKRITSSSRLIMKLLEKGASMEILNQQGHSPLHLALLLKHDVAIDVLLKFIVRTGEYVNVRGKKGLTHFHVACTRRNVEVIEGFVESGVDFNEAVDMESDYWPGYTAKHFAVEFQSLEAVRVLSNRETDEERSCRALDKNGRTPEDLARKSLEELSIMVYLSGEREASERDYEVQVSQFHMACSQDNPRLVRKFIENGVAVNSAVSEKVTFCPGYSPLHYAVESNSKKNVELLLKQGAEVEYQDANCMSALHLALYNENPKETNTIVDLLYKTLSIEDKLFNIMDVNGLNYFHIAITRNELDVVKTFLARGEAIEHQVLHNHRQFAHYRPLHFAIRYRHFEMAKYLVERGADVQAISKDGPPLHIAIEVNQPDIIELLLENNAAVNAIRKIDGKTMLHSLVETYMDNSEDFEDANDLHNWNKNHLLIYIERLVKRGCDVNHRDYNGNTPLHVACNKIDDGIPCVRLLLNYGADINVENTQGETPFNCAFHDSYRMNADSYMLLYHHVQKLKIMGFLMNLKNESCCQKILDESNECEPNAVCFRMSKLDDMKQQRRDEMINLKCIKLTPIMSLYGFLRLSTIDAANYVTNEKLKQIVKHDDKFPVYGYLIRLQFDRASRYFNYFVMNNVDSDDCSLDETRRKRQRFH